MLAYVIRRLLLIPLTLVGIITINFFIVQIAPGGPVEQLLAQIQGTAVDATARFSGGGGTGEITTDHGGGGGGGGSSGGQATYQGARGLDPAFIAEIERQFGFDKPIYERYWHMLVSYATFDLGESYYRSTGVLALIWEKMPVSVSLGVWSTLIIYFVSIPLGIAKAVRDGSRFDIATSWAVIVGYAVPGFLFAILLIVLFAHGGAFDLFPLRGLFSENWASLTWYQKIGDYAWHLALPVTAMVIGGFASLTMLTKNSFLEEVNKQYVITARAKGLTERRILYGHIFRNAMLLVVAGFPAALVSMLFTGSLLIEVIFSLDGLGLLGFQAVINRDYPVMFGTLYIFGLLGLVLNLMSDMTYHIIDPRIDFESREV